MYTGYAYFPIIALTSLKAHIVWHTPCARAMYKIYAMLLNACWISFPVERNLIFYALRWMSSAVASCQLPVASCICDCWWNSNSHLGSQRVRHFACNYAAQRCVLNAIAGEKSDGNTCCKQARKRYANQIRLSHGSEWRGRQRVAATCLLTAYVCNYKLCSPCALKSFGHMLWDVQRHLRRQLHKNSNKLLHMWLRGARATAGPGRQMLLHLFGVP